MRGFASILLIAALLLSFAIPCTASPGTGIGFVSTKAPVGVRLALGPGMSIDAGVGYSKTGDVENWTFDGGVPLTLQELGKARALFRPGVTYEKYGETGAHLTTYSAAIEGEVFPVDKVGASMSFGATYSKPKDGAETVRTFGVSSEVGFHLYLLR